MQNFRIRSSSTQLADFLRAEITSGSLGPVMPGETWLTSNLRVGRNIVRAAIKQLEKERVLISQGAGKPRLIRRGRNEPSGNYRVTLLVYSPSSRYMEDTQRLLRRLGELGYRVQVAPKTLTELGMNPARVARMVEKVQTNAWVVFSGSKDVLEWFANQPKPAFALYGRFPESPIAWTGPGRFPAYQAAIQSLVKLGHRRIVFLLPEAMRKPTPSRLLLRIIDELENLGVSTGQYTHPDWRETPEDLLQCVDKLFKHTPPTALFISQPRELHAIERHLAAQDIIAPRDVSLICTEQDSDFEWSRPLTSHFDWSVRPCINRIARWVANASRGNEDKRGSFTPVKFIEGGTIGPAPKG